ncbi:hypothetical protein CYMTET_11120 [Cymbomonas tetramitiformis]|uniref:Uncharacterized protein n=1 Tax=Cymbomonas tetramitiformis TaxID=36881 RepID=A0AAE0LDS3_9CHLO|nr:hypothetical protein CYMTET_11120 [Cymbomonas tetramitiformis]
MLFFSSQEKLAEREATDYGYEEVEITTSMKDNLSLFIVQSLVAVMSASAAILHHKWLLHTFFLFTNIHRLKELRPARTTFDLALTLLLLNISCLFQYISNLYFIYSQHTAYQSLTVSNEPELFLISASFTAGILGLGYEVAKRSHVEVEESGEQEYFFIGGASNFE